MNILTIFKKVLFKVIDLMLLSELAIWTLVLTSLVLIQNQW